MAFGKRSDSPDRPARSLLYRARVSLLLFAGACSAAWIRADLPGPESRPPGDAAEAEPIRPTPPGPAHAPPSQTATVSATISPTSSPSADLSRTATADIPEGSRATSLADEEPMRRALRTMKGCREAFQKVHDYTCTFYKRELLNGRLSPLNVMAMKARTRPASIYFKFEEPNRGREAIYVDGRNRGNIMVHEAGLVKFLAGTMEIAPTSARAMEECRHPITEAGIGNLIDTVTRRWELELSPGETLLLFDPDVVAAGRRCLLVEAVHPKRQPHFQFYKVRLFIDADLNLPVRFEGYDWPSEPGGPGTLAEEYAYVDLKLNVGLGDIDFDVANKQYAFGRF
ncbi:hypothetical protein OJF2_19990 [Aquisphaera giovannonii]|uniref:Uncharacterized protein n=1 Tax=Aquisphaera giovannonii TaxID=406548 RepID=A0A5B9VZU4_9BACT|nr:DUF1571 domain-containing protein [Aquisphaera giovannonii]QEH33497.1 hypothetical protein OJF2_19990 [Aquisphaera giovannonii]